MAKTNKTKLEKELEVLLQKKNKAYISYSNKEDEYNALIALPSLRKSIGKCFKFINSYGSSYPKWNLYLKVISIDEKTLSFKCIQFQKTSMDKIEVGLESKFNWRGESYFNDSNYIEITNAEYNRAKKSLLKFISEKLKS